MRARIFVVAAVALQLFFIVRAYWDPHRRFGYQPFGEYSVWRADVVRVTRDGRRIPAGRKFHGTRWSAHVRCCGLHSVSRLKPAKRGIGSTLAYFQLALDYVADHTPEDPDTLFYEAKVTYLRNRGDPVELIMTSKRRLP
jgi:hypothetical protein